MIEFIGQIVFELFIGIPGSLILWGLGGFKGSYSDIFDNHQNKSTLIGLIFWITIAGIIAFATQFTP